MNVCPACEYRGKERACPVDGLPMVDERLFADETRDPDLPGTIFEGRYEVDALIGRGGMGWVFKARHLTMRHDVALKLLRRDVARDMNAVRRFYQEARACAQLKHPNTIKVHDFGASSDGFLFLVMEFLDGKPLGQVLRRQGPLGVQRTLHVARQICESLDEAHALGLVHRDLKPDNVILTRIHRLDDYAKVVDFGIAKLAHQDDGAAGLTRTGHVVGTPRYMSPEQAQARPVDRRSDLYSLGIMLYEMLTGDVPFRSQAVAALLVDHASKAPPPLPAQVQGERIPAALRRLVASLLAKDPGERPGTAAELGDSLSAIGDELRSVPKSTREPFDPCSDEDGRAEVDVRPSAEGDVTSRAVHMPHAAGGSSRPTLPVIEPSASAASTLASSDASTSSDEAVHRPRRWWPWLAGSIGLVVAVVLLARIRVGADQPLSAERGTTAIEGAALPSARPVDPPSTPAVALPAPDALPPAEPPVGEVARERQEPASSQAGGPLDAASDAGRPTQSAQAVAQPDEQDVVEHEVAAPDAPPQARPPQSSRRGPLEKTRPRRDRQRKQVEEAEPKRATPPKDKPKLSIPYEI